MRLCWHRILLLPVIVILVATVSVDAQPTVSTAVRTDARSVTSSTDTPSRARMYHEVAAEFEALERERSLLKKVVRLTRPTVVHLESLKFDDEATASPSGRSEPTVEEAGSGVIVEIASKFYVLTNRHVIRNASLSNISIRTYDGRFLTARRVWADSDTDVAIIRVAQQDDLIGARIGNSNQLEIGDFVLAVGSPFGLSHSVSYGIISAKGRRDLELGDEYVRLQDFLQTDAAINPGNSGGPLLNLKGEVIAINTAIASASGGNEGVSFSIPIDLVMFVARQLVADGEVTHAYLGVQLDNEFDREAALQMGLPFLRGALVRGITPRSPAYFANLRIGDLVIRFNAQDVEDDDHLVNLVSLTPVGGTVPVEVIRENRRLRIDVTVGNRKHFESSNNY